MTAIRELPEDYRRVGTLDLRNDRTARSISFALRMLTLVVFVPLFAGVAWVIRPEIRRDPAVLWNLGGSEFPVILIYLALGALIVAMLILHELVHLAVFRLSGAGDSRIGVNGFAVFAWADGWYTRRGAMVLNAAAPFFVISAAGVSLFPLVSAEFFGWVYLPVVINAAAAAGDYMGIAWLLMVPRGAWISDEGETLTAYAPVLTDEESVQ